MAIIGQKLSVSTHTLGNCGFKFYTVEGQVCSHEADFNNF
jgi:hypothetical protein